MTTVIVYRGPFQGRRIRFLLDAAHAQGGSVDLVWLNPSFRPDEPTSWFQDLRVDRPFIGALAELDGSRRGIVSAGRELRQRWRRADLAFAVGFTSLPYARLLGARRLFWAVNGIPEERVMHDPNLRTRAQARLSWILARCGRRPNGAIVVSDPMGRLVSDRLGGVPWVKAPTAVDAATFCCPEPLERSFLTYVGSGAPWQAVDLLGEIWGEIHRLDPTCRFRIVSRDPRADVLRRRLPDDVVETVAGTSPSHVASLLWEAELGFLVRRPDIVNTASFPTKFGEYVAAGVPVISTDIGWEVGDIIRRTGCGLLVSHDDPPSTVAAAVVDFRKRLAADGSIAQACEAATSELRRDVWLDRLTISLEELR